MTLTRVARALVTQLRQPGAVDKISQEAGVSFDWEVKLQRLEEPLDALETVLDGLAHRLRPTVPRRRSRPAPTDSKGEASASREAPAGPEAE